MEVLRNIGNVPMQLYPSGDICLQILAIETMIFYRQDQEKKTHDKHEICIKEGDDDGDEIGSVRLVNSVS